MASALEVAKTELRSMHDHVSTCMSMGGERDAGIEGTPSMPGT